MVFGFSCFFSFCSPFFCFCCLGGFKGQMRWPPHLALNPPYLFLFFVGLVLRFFPLFAFNRKSLFCPFKKGHFCLYFSVSPSFSFSVSLSLSLSLSYSFLSSFLLFFLFCFVLLPCFCFLLLLLFLCFCFMKRTSKY